MTVELRALHALGAPNERRLLAAARAAGVRVERSEYTGAGRVRFEELAASLEPALVERLRAAARERGLSLDTGSFTVASVPEVARQWHPTRNGDLTPDRVSRSARLRVFWRCDSGHEWKALVFQRTGSRRTGCPTCSRAARSGPSLAARFPALASEWHPALNGKLRPEDVPSRSTTAVWWRCRNDPAHVWRASPFARARPKGGGFVVTRCRFCLRLAPVPPARSVATLRPDVARYWHPTLNGALTPNDVHVKSGREVHWSCPEGPDHVWEAPVYSRTAPGATLCPFCAGRKVSVTNSLSGLYPAIARLWNPRRNGARTAAEVLASSSGRYWWRCLRGHEFRAEPHELTQEGYVCPVCAGRTDQKTIERRARHPVRQKRPTVAAFPAIAAQWHPAKNGELRPEDVGANSKVPRWWRCAAAKDHEWRTSPANRQRTGCPFCAGRRASSTRSLALLRPDLARQWHPTKNGALTPEQVLPTTLRPVFWCCPNRPGHVFRQPVAIRVGSGGPGCPVHRVAPGDSLAARFPRIAAEWHPTRNRPLSPRDVGPGSSREVFWKCPAGPDHVWKLAVGSRAKGGVLRRCPFCADQLVSVTNSLAARFPRIASQWHPTANGRLRPRDVIATSRELGAWLCPVGHTWRAPPLERTARGRGCPFCAGWLGSGSGRLPGLPRRPSKPTVADFPELAAQWHPSRNGDLRPEHVGIGSKHVAWWRCPAGADHEWHAPVFSRRPPGTRCPFCIGRRASSTRSLARLHPRIARFWHPTKNGSLTAADVLPGAKKKVWWCCPIVPGHSFFQRISCRVDWTGPGCPNHRIAPEDSLAAKTPRVAAEWHPTKNRPLTPRDVGPGSSREVFWRCPAGPDHVWQSAVSTRTRHGEGGRCPFCMHRRVSVTNSLAARAPRIAREWHPTANGGLRPEDVLATSRERRAWLCPLRHTWRAPPLERTAEGRACPACAAGLEVPRRGRI